MTAIKNYCKRTDILYLLACVALSCLSVATLISMAQYASAGGINTMRTAYTQIFASALGIICAVVVSLIDYRVMLRLWPLHMAVCWGLVLLTFVPGIGYSPGNTGSQSWIAMPFGMSFQPTEIAKISFYLSFALHLEAVHDTLSKPKSLLPVLFHMFVPVLIVHFQGDDGTALVFMAIALVMLFMAGLNRWVVIGCITVAAVAVPFLWKYMLGSYQKDRILGLFTPEKYKDTIMHQQLVGREAIASGGLFGKGLFQPDHVYVPLQKNDFIFSYFAESWGFLGSILLLGLLAAIILRTLWQAARADSLAGAYICLGVFAALIFQTVTNVGMNLMLLPVMGLTLPFVSAGGSSVLMLYISAGLVLSVGRGSSHGGETLSRKIKE